MSWSRTTRLRTPLIFFVTSVMVVTVRCGTVRPPIVTVPFLTIWMPGVIGTQLLKSEPWGSKFWGSKTLGIFSGVGEAGGRGDFVWCEGRCDGVPPPGEVDVGGAAVSSAPEHPDSRAQTKVPMTKDQVAARCPSMHRC